MKENRCHYPAIMTKNNRAFRLFGENRLILQIGDTL